MPRKSTGADLARDDRNLKRILCAVGAPHVPDGLDRKALIDDLWSAEAWYRTREDRSVENKLREKLAQIEKTARRLKLLVDDDVWRRIGSECPTDSRVALGHLITAVNTALKPAPLPICSPEEAAARKAAATQIANEMHIEERSAFEWLAGYLLPRLFKKHFRAEATAQNSKREADTPYVRFARLALAALSIRKGGKPYSRGSIAKALTGVRSGEIRRRRKAATGQRRKEI